MKSISYHTKNWYINTRLDARIITHHKVTIGVYVGTAHDGCDSWPMLMLEQELGKGTYKQQRKLLHKNHKELCKQFKI